MKKEAGHRSGRRLKRFCQVHQGWLDKERKESRLLPTVTLDVAFVQSECWRDRVLT